jgi:cytochrome c6
MIPNLARALRAFPRPGILVAFLALAAGGADAADVQKGGRIYGAQCAVCHGADGTPVMPGTPNFKRMDRLMRPDMQLLMSIRTGKGAMPGYFGVLRDAEILDVIAYLRTLN